MSILDFVQKINLTLIILNRISTMKEEQSAEILVIGYYPFRAKAEICRLLCEYLHVPYVNRFFTPDEWSKFKENQAQQWVIKDLPFLIHKYFSVTGTTAMIQYILEVTGRVDMLGRTIAETIKIDSIRIKFDVRNAILALICTHRPNKNPQDKKSLKHYWTSKIEPILLGYQTQCPQQNWYFGLISIMDFLVYDIMNLMDEIFPAQVQKFKKLNSLRKRFGGIKQIYQYQHSQRSIKQFCPVSYFSRFQQQNQRLMKGGFQN